MVHRRMAARRMCISGKGSDPGVVDDLGMLVKTHAQTIRPSARHARPPDPENARARATARLGHLEAHSAPLRRGARRATGVAVPGASSAGATGMDHRRVERYGTGPQRKVLYVDARGEASTRARARNLETALFGRRPAPGTRMISSHVDDISLSPASRRTATHPRPS